MCFQMLNLQLRLKQSSHKSGTAKVPFSEKTPVCHVQRQWRRERACLNHLFVVQMYLSNGNTGQCECCYPDWANTSPDRTILLPFLNASSMPDLWSDNVRLPLYCIEQPDSFSECFLISELTSAYCSCSMTPLPCALVCRHVIYSHGCHAGHIAVLGRPVVFIHIPIKNSHHNLCVPDECGQFCPPLGG